LTKELNDVAEAEGDDAAASHLVELLESREFEDIELKSMFEYCLLEANLIPLFERFRAWQIFRDMIHQRELLRSTAAYETVPRGERIQYLALEMVTARANAALFYRTLWRYPELAKAVSSHVHRLEQEAPAAIPLYFDKKTIRWWARRKPLPGAPIRKPDRQAVAIRIRRIVDSVADGIRRCLLDAHVLQGLFRDRRFARIGLFVDRHKTAERLCQVEGVSDRVRDHQHGVLVAISAAMAYGRDMNVPFAIFPRPSKSKERRAHRPAI
jgi:hypothetical protein